MRDLELYKDVAAQIKGARESQGLSREALAEKARVPLSVVRNLEDGVWEELPEAVYMRHFLERISQVLQLPPEIMREGAFESHIDLSSVVVGKVREEGIKPKVLLLFVVLLMLTIGGFSVWKGWKSLGQHPGPRASSTASLGKSHAVGEGIPPPASKEGPSTSIIEREEPDKAMAAQVEFHKLEIRARERCWVWMKLEDGSVRDFILKPHESYRITFRKGVQLRVGNAGAVAIVVDKKMLPFKAEEGQPKTLYVTPLCVVE